MKERWWSDGHAGCAHVGGDIGGQWITRLRHMLTFRAVDAMTAFIADPVERERVRTGGAFRNRGLAPLAGKFRAETELMK